MKSVLFCSVALSLAGLLCCHELENSVYNSFDSPLIPLDNNYKIHQIWNNFNNFFKKRINSFEQVWSGIFPSDNIRFQNSNEIIYTENLPTRKVEENVLKRIVRSDNDHQNLDQSTESNVSMPTTPNKTNETSIPKNATQSKTNETSVLTNTIQTDQSVSMSTTHSKTDPSVSIDTILNVSTNIAGNKMENKTDPSIFMNTTQNSTEPNLNVDKTTDLSITSLIINKPTGQNATLEKDTKENTLLSSDTSSYSPFKIFSVLALLGIVVGLLYVVYQKQRSRVRNACYQVRDICRNNEETPV